MGSVYRMGLGKRRGGSCWAVVLAGPAGKERGVLGQRCIEWTSGGWLGLRGRRKGRAGWAGYWPGAH